MRRRLIVVLVSGLLAAGGTGGVLATNLPDARGTEQRSSDVAEAERRIRHLHERANALREQASTLQQMVHAVGRKNAALGRHVDQQERRIRQLERELASLD